MASSTARMMRSSDLSRIAASFGTARLVSSFNGAIGFLNIAWQDSIQTFNTHEVRQQGFECRFTHRSQQVNRRKSRLLVCAVEIGKVMVYIFRGFESSVPNASQPVSHIGSGFVMCIATQVRFGCLPITDPAVPTGLSRIAGSRKVELDHVPGLIGEISQAGMLVRGTR